MPPAGTLSSPGYPQCTITELEPTAPPAAAGPSIPGFPPLPFLPPNAVAHISSVHTAAATTLATGLQHVATFLSAHSSLRPHAPTSPPSQPPPDAAPAPHPHGPHIPHWIRHLEHGLHLHLPSTSHRRAQQLAERSLAAERALRPEEAAEALQEAVRLEPRNVVLLGRLAKALSDSAFRDGVPRQLAAERHRAAIEVADKAIELAPHLPDGHLARCVSRGRLALLSDTRTLVALAQQSQRDAATAVQVAPDSDIAHHLFGRWHYEMAGQNWVVRTAVKVFLGTELPPGTLQDALACFQRAAELRPQRLIHQVELGRTLARLGQRDEAAVALRRALELEVEDINAALELEDATTLLATLPAPRRPMLRWMGGWGQQQK